MTSTPKAGDDVEALIERVEKHAADLARERKAKPPDWALKSIAINAMAEAAPELARQLREARSSLAQADAALIWMETGEGDAPQHVYDAIEAAKFRALKETKHVG